MANARVRATRCVFGGVMRSSTKDPKLAAFNNVIMALESEIDPATSTLKGGGCEWK